MMHDVTILLLAFGTFHLLSSVFLEEKNESFWISFLLDCAVIFIFLCIIEILCAKGYSKIAWGFFLPMLFLLLISSSFTIYSLVKVNGGWKDLKTPIYEAIQD